MWWKRLPRKLPTQRDTEQRDGEAPSLMELVSPGINSTWSQRYPYTFALCDPVSTLCSLVQLNSHLCHSQLRVLADAVSTLHQLWKEWSCQPVQAYSEKPLVPWRQLPELAVGAQNKREEGKDGGREGESILKKKANKSWFMRYELSHT